MRYYYAYYQKTKFVSKNDFQVYFMIMSEILSNYHSERHSISEVTFRRIYTLKCMNQMIKSESNFKFFI